MGNAKRGFKPVSALMCLVIQVFLGSCALAENGELNQNSVEDLISTLWLQNQIENEINDHQHNKLEPNAVEKQSIKPTDVEVKPHILYTAPKFEPINMSFPDTVRIGAEAEAYKKEKLASLPARAQKEDPNLKITGESCARGLGSLYEV